MEPNKVIINLPSKLTRDSFFNEIASANAELRLGDKVYLGADITSEIREAAYAVEYDKDRQPVKATVRELILTEEEIAKKLLGELILKFYNSCYKTNREHEYKVKMEKAHADILAEVFPDVETGEGGSIE